MSAEMKSQVQADRLDLGKSIPLATPLVVYVEPSGFCNLKCAFCPQGGAPEGLKMGLMQVGLFRKMINDVSHFPEKIKLLRICGNGDPLMNKHLPAMLQYAYEEKVTQRIELLTNGALLSHGLIRDLPQFIDRIVCSIEGLCSEDYQRICGTKIDFQMFLYNLDSLYASKGKCVIHIKIHHEAVSSPEKEKQFLEIFGGRCDEIFVEKLVPMWPQLDTEYSSNEFRWGNAGVTKREICPQIFKGVQVQADGEVVPCCVDWKRVNVLGNINTDSLIEIWNGPKLRKIQLEHLSGNKKNLLPCKDCTMNDYCEIDNIDQHAEECIKRLKLEGLL